MTKIVVFESDEFWQKMEQLIKEQKGSENKPPKWLRSKDIRKLLNISDSTLQTLRINGTIPCYKLGTSWFYKLEEIIAALEAGKIRKEVAND